MSHDLACLFATAPIADCGRDIVVPASVLASSWPALLIFGPAVVIGSYAFLRAIYRRRIDWSRDPSPEWDVGADDHPTIEIRARRAGE